MKWATENGCSWEDTTGNDYGIACPMFAAAKRGHLHVLRWIREEVCDDDDVWGGDCLEAVAADASDEGSRAGSPPPSASMEAGSMYSASPMGD